MNITQLKNKLNNYPRIKTVILKFLVHPVKARPQWWIRIFQRFYMQTYRGCVIYRSVRKDLVPFNLFKLGYRSVIEDFSVLNNSVGNIIIGNECRVGIGNTIIGPVRIGDNVNLAQNVTISGLNHIFEDIDKKISEQGISTSPINIYDDVWIGANSVVLAGVSIGKHSIIGAGSVVTKDIPPYSVAVGNPAHVIKQYDSDLKKWIKTV